MFEMRVSARLLLSLTCVLALPLGCSTASSGAPSNDGGMPQVGAYAGGSVASGSTAGVPAPDGGARSTAPGGGAGGVYANISDAGPSDRSGSGNLGPPDASPALGGAANPDSGAPTAGAPAILVEHIATTQLVDPAATVDLAPQYAYIDQRVPTRDQLVVYLGYSRSTPSTHSAMLQFIASLGYRVLSPQYRNDAALMNPCYQGTSANPDCFYNARLEVFDGIDHSPDIDVRPADSIEVRVAQFLAYLAVKFPSEGWERYLDIGKPKWSDIIVAGHSQGAASTALISKVRGIYRAILFAGPDDNDAKTKAAASWPGKAGITPTAQIFAFINRMDLNYSHDAANWSAQGLGLAQPIDAQQPPYLNAHFLTSSLAFPQTLGSNGAHLMLAAPATPVGSNGSYVYAPVWQYLFGVSP